MARGVMELDGRCQAIGRIDVFFPAPSQHSTRLLGHTVLLGSTRPRSATRTKPVGGAVKPSNHRPGLGEVPSHEP